MRTVVQVPPKSTKIPSKSIADELLWRSYLLCDVCSKYSVSVSDTVSQSTTQHRPPQPPSPCHSPAELLPPRAPDLIPCPAAHTPNLRQAQHGPEIQQCTRSSGPSLPAPALPATTVPNPNHQARSQRSVHVASSPAPYALPLLLTPDSDRVSRASRGAITPASASAASASSLGCSTRGGGGAGACMLR